jgi:signal transduction protein with GAF and PtsI domain
MDEVDTQSSGSETEEEYDEAHDDPIGNLNQLVNSLENVRIGIETITKDPSEIIQAQRMLFESYITSPKDTTLTASVAVEVSHGAGATPEKVPRKGADPLEPNPSYA